MERILCGTLQSNFRRWGALSEPERDETSDIPTDEVQVAITALKPGKAAGIDETRPELLKFLSRHGILWLTRVCRVAWREGRASVDWQTGIIVPVFKKGDWRECSNYRGITQLSFPGKIYARVLERKCRTIVEPKTQDTQYGFRPGRGTTEPLSFFTKSSRGPGNLPNQSILHL